MIDNFSRFIVNRIIRKRLSNPIMELSSEFLQYLVSYEGDGNQAESDGGIAQRLPALSEISKELGVSIASLREQLEVAKAIGLVEVRPRTGIRRLPYTFFPAVHQSLSYAISTDSQHFLEFADLRNHIEASYWFEAASKLTPEDHQDLKDLLARAWKKLKGQPIRIPHTEHRELHLCVFRRLGNPFVLGLLEAYWQAYESVGLNVYADYNYLEQVWNYHQDMVDAICAGDLEKGYQALVEHKDLLFHRPNSGGNRSEHSDQS
jgi:DNA-binding FadR family transcriptional regulator